MHLSSPLQYAHSRGHPRKDCEHATSSNSDWNHRAEEKSRQRHICVQA